MDKQIYTPGPTTVHPDVLRALSRRPTNADLDDAFYEVFRDLSGQLSDFMGSSGPSLILLGEAILGLESALATFIDKGDKVVSIANGVFGHGFADFAQMYGADSTVVSTGYDNIDFDYSEIEREIKDAAVCTMVHCETPSGVLNPLIKVGRLCQEFDTLFVVDAVSSVFGSEMKADEWGIDVLLGGSQKALSLPTGLTLITLSKRARQKLDQVSDSSTGFYANLTNWINFLEGDNWLPYTHSQSFIYALEKGFELIDKEGLENVLQRHEKIAKGVRQTLVQAGLELFPVSPEICSPTVTAYRIPDNIDDRAFRNKLWNKYGLMISGSLGKLDGVVQRLGHMGYQAGIKQTTSALSLLEKAFQSEGFQSSLQGWGENFLSVIKD